MWCDRLNDSERSNLLGDTIAQADLICSLSALALLSMNPLGKRIIFGFKHFLRCFSKPKLVERDSHLLKDSPLYKPRKVFCCLFHWTHADLMGCIIGFRSKMRNLRLHLWLGDKCFLSLMCLLLCGCFCYLCVYK